MNKNRTITLIVIVVVCGVISFVGTRIAAVGSQKTASRASVPWLAEAAPSVIELEEKFDREVDGLIEGLLREQKSLASVIEDPCTPDEPILAQAENVIAAHERLLRRVGEHVAMLRLKLPGAQRKHLMDLCAEVLRGPIGQGRGRGNGGGRRMGWQDSSGPGRGRRGYGFGREANPFLLRLVGEPGFLVLKVAGVLLAALILWDVHRRHHRLAVRLAAVAVAAYTIIVVWNISIFF